MPSHKDKVTAAIVAAKADLDQALADLEHLPAFDPGVVGFAAHALSNYLSVADGAIELLALALQGKADPEIHHWLQVLRQTTDRMEHKNSQLMNVSARSGPKLTLGRVDAVQGVRRACDYYQRVANRKEIHILFEPADDVPFVRTDRVAVAAVLDNLLSNAVKYSDQGKRVWVRLRLEGDAVVCAVQDEGPGLTPEDRERLFQKGVRLSATPTGGEPSTGYGLAVAKELMSQLSGEIWCDSEPGQGACFSIRLPIDHEGPSEKP
jgi:two-component system sensor histidine kinase/response regulator